nr:hypothetical protein [Tanacetum cinerariifolium]
MAIPEDHLAKFHKMTDAKEMWEAFKSRFGGNDESKKMQKYHLKQKFESFSDERKAMVTIDGEGVDWTGHTEDETEDYALMAFNSSNSGSDTEDKSGLGYGSPIHDGVLSYENEVFASVFNSRSSDVEDSLVNDRFSNVEGIHVVPLPMTKNYMPSKYDFRIDESNFTYGLKQSTTSESNAKTNDLDSCDSSSSEETLETVPKLVESKPKVVNEPKVWSDAPIIEEYKSDKAEKEKEELKTKLENFQSSSKGLSKLLNSQMSAKDKSELGYGSQIHDGVLSYENEVFESVFDSRTSDVEDSHVNDRFAKVKGMHAVPPSRTRNYMPSKSDFRIDESKFTYGLKQSTTSESNAKTSDLDSCESSSSKETLETVPKPVESKPKDNPHQTLKRKGIIDSGCSRHITGNKAYLVDYQDFNGGPVAFGGSKGHITDTECLVLSPDFKLPDENQVLLRVLRKHNMYSFNLENIIPSRGLACLIAKATIDESTKWHRRIKREYNNARIPQQNGVAERKNKTLIEAARTMLADSFLPNTFWPKAVSTACYVLNSVLVTKPQNKTPYEFLTGKFEEKSDEGFLVGYSLSNKAFRPITAENKANKTSGPKETNNTTSPKETNNSVGTQDSFDAGNSKMEADHAQEYCVLPLWYSYTLTVKSLKAKNGDEKIIEDNDLKTNEEPVDQEDQAFLEELKRLKR